jgi:hypothetical protein
MMEEHWYCHSCSACVHVQCHGKCEIVASITSKKYRQNSNRDASCYVGWPPLLCWVATTAMLGGYQSLLAVADLYSSFVCTCQPPYQHRLPTHRWLATCHGQHMLVETSMLVVVVVVVGVLRCCLNEDQSFQSMHPPHSGRSHLTATSLLRSGKMPLPPVQRTYIQLQHMQPEPRYMLGVV